MQKLGKLFETHDPRLVLILYPEQLENPKWQTNPA